MGKIIYNLDIDCDLCGQEKKTKKYIGDDFVIHVCESCDMDKKKK